jgi:hypothetical protein
VQGTQQQEAGKRHWQEEEERGMGTVLAVGKTLVGEERRSQKVGRG